MIGLDEVEDEFLPTCVDRSVRERTRQTRTMRVNAALTITALLATLAVARGMEFDLVDRYAPHSCAPSRARHP